MRYAEGVNHTSWLHGWQDVEVRENDDQDGSLRVDETRKQQRYRKREPHLAWPDYLYCHLLEPIIVHLFLLISSRKDTRYLCMLLLLNIHSWTISTAVSVLSESKTVALSDQSCKWSALLEAFPQSVLEPDKPIIIVSVF